MKARGVLLLLVVTFVAFSAHGAVFWEENFENHLIPNWDTAACNGGAVYPGPQDGCNPRITNAVAHTGTHSLLADYTCQGAPSTQCGTFMDRLHPASSERYTRFFYRIYAQAGSGLMYYDDFAIGDTRIGGGTADTMPPAAPRGLKLL